jgi:L-lactate dehydrogenase
MPPSSLYDTHFKVAFVGCGNVGATAAYATLLSGIASDIALMDLNAEKIEGLMLDFEHTLSFLSTTRITAETSYKVCKDADVIVISAGARQKEGETRLDLIAKNRAIFKSMIPALTKVAPQSLLLIVTNPVDVLIHEATRLAGFPKGRVFGSGTLLDTARFRFHLAEKLGIHPKSIEAFILGEHGDSSFPVWSSANIAGKPLLEFKKLTPKSGDECYQAAKKAAYRIIHDMGFTCYSIGVVVREILQAIAEDARSVAPLSVELHGEYGYRNVALSVPCVLGREGVLEVLKVPLNAKEKAALKRSVEVLKGA